MTSCCESADGQVQLFSVCPDEGIIGSNIAWKSLRIAAARLGKFGNLAYKKACGALIFFGAVGGGALALSWSGVDV